MKSEVIMAIKAEDTINSSLYFTCSFRFDRSSSAPAAAAALAA